MTHNWIYLSKDGKDEYIKLLADSVGGTIVSTDNFDYDQSSQPIVLRGILKHKLMQRCQQDNRPFFYMDTGYFGNKRWKEWHRIVKNDLQHNQIIHRPSDRFNKLKISFRPWRRTGSKILFALPDDKPCKFYGIDRETFISDTVAKIQQHTDRPIVLRERVQTREIRTVKDTLRQALDKDIFALVTFNSNSAIESILHGIPAFVLAPSHAAMPVSKNDLSQIESPFYADRDLLFQWACHLAYGQFHVTELRNGTALRMLDE